MLFSAEPEEAYQRAAEKSSADIVTSIENISENAGRAARPMQ